MRKSEIVEQWVVYEAIQGAQLGMKSVCVQSEWEKIKLHQPGLNRLIQQGIASETEAEILARGTSGDVKPRKTKPREHRE